MNRVAVGLSKRLRVDQLEDRCVLAGLSWPVQPDAILSTYGQYQNVAGAKSGDPDLVIHFHEGLDIVAAAGTKVYAIEAGQVIGYETDSDYSNRVSVATSDHG